MSLVQRTTTPKRAREMADKAAKQLATRCKAGLPECYSSFEESLYDWYADLPWDSVGGKIAAEHILSVHTETLSTVKEVFKFDMEEDLRKYVEECGGAP